MAASGKPLFGTCAGLILLAKRIEGAESAHLALMDITVRRNAFGRQRESFETDLPVAGMADDFRAVFIRAPYITEAGPGVDVLSRIDDKIVAARQGHLLASAFHPELTDDVRMHAYFVEMVREASAVTASEAGRAGNGFRLVRDTMKKETYFKGEDENQYPEGGGSREAVVGANRPAPPGNPSRSRARKRRKPQKRRPDRRPLSRPEVDRGCVFPVKKGGNAGLPSL